MLISINTQYFIIIVFLEFAIHINAIRISLQIVDLLYATSKGYGHCVNVWTLLGDKDGRRDSWPVSEACRG